ncbi:hypothetical protein M0R45_020640 [Rubus argutus]|uniref:Peptidase A1 domain-containing protein n=1 Tax=Rubus argutus TaxID=59490 RepID=A0AAW1XA50_RUBAR
MASTSQCLLFCLVLVIFQIIITPSLAKTSFRPKALVLPVAKDASTLQYVTTIKQGTPLVPVKLTVDLGGQYLWVDCGQGFVSSTYKLSLPIANPPNASLQTPTGGAVGQDVVSGIHSTEGSNPVPVVSAPNVLFACGYTSLLHGLANGLTSMAGLGNFKIGFPYQLSAALGIKRKFAICLSSSTSSNGVVFFGKSPYHFLPAGIDVSKSLTFTPLIINPVSTGLTYNEEKYSSQYFIGVKSIKVNGKVISSLNTSLLAIDENGNGGTEISTVVPYTVLETSTYNNTGRTGCAPDRSCVTERERILEDCCSKLDGLASALHFCPESRQTSCANFNFTSTV